VKAGGW